MIPAQLRLSVARKRFSQIVEKKKEIMLPTKSLTCAKRTRKLTDKLKNPTQYKNVCIRDPVTPGKLLKILREYDMIEKYRYLKFCADVC